MKRATLSICTSCRFEDARADPIAFFARLKASRKAQGLKPWFRLKESRCLRGCDTPCNARLEAKRRKTIDLTWLDALDDVEALLDAAKRYATDGKLGELPGRPGH